MKLTLGNKYAVALLGSSIFGILAVAALAAFADNPGKFAEAGVSLVGRCAIIAAVVLWICGAFKSQQIEEPRPISTPVAITRAAKLRRISLCAGILLAISVLVPPWKHTFYRSRASEDAGYSLVFSPPKPEGGSDGISLDMPRLILEWIGIAAVAGIACLLVPPEKKETSAPKL